MLDFLEGLAAKPTPLGRRFLEQSGRGRLPQASDDSCRSPESQTARPDCW